MGCADVFHHSEKGFYILHIDFTLSTLGVDDDSPRVVRVVPRFDQNVDLPLDAREGPTDSGASLPRQTPEELAEAGFGAGDCRYRYNARTTASPGVALSGGLTHRFQGSGPLVQFGHERIETRSDLLARTEDAVVTLVLAIERNRYRLIDRHYVEVAQQSPEFLSTTKTARDTAVAYDGRGFVRPFVEQALDGVHERSGNEVVVFRRYEKKRVRRVNAAAPTLRGFVLVFSHCRVRWFIQQREGEVREIN